MSVAVTEGQNFLPDGSQIQLIKYQKHPSEYEAQTANAIRCAIFRACAWVSLAAGRVLQGFVALTDEEGRVRLTGHQMAQACNIGYVTFVRAKQELLKEGLIYRVREARRPTDPDEIYVADLVARFSVVSNLNSTSVVSNLNSDDLLPTHVRTDDLEGIFQDELPLTHLESFHGKLKERTVQKESDIDTCDPGCAQYEDDLSSLFADPVVYPTAPKFQLTPPNLAPKAETLKTKRKGQKRWSPIPPQLLNWIVGLCYGVTTSQQWVTMDKVALGRCSTAIQKLRDSGADLNRIRDFDRWWWSFAKFRPSPETVVRNWVKAMEDGETLSNIRDGLLTGAYKGRDVKASEDVLKREAQKYLNVERAMFIGGLDKNKLFTAEERERLIREWDEEHGYKGGA